MLNQQQTEEWKEIEGFEGMYEISNFGKVKSLERITYKLGKNGAPSHQPVPEKILKPFPQVNGYLCVHLRKDNKAHAFRVHRLVAAAFIGKIPIGMQVCHNDGNIQNNRHSNLRIDTVAKNHADKNKHGTDNKGSKHPLSTITERDVIDMRNSTKTHTALAKEYNLSIGHISEIRNYKKWKHVA